MAPSHLALAPANMAEKLAAEFVGVFFLTLTASLNVAQAIVSGGLAIAAALACLVYSLGSISGAHLNPAVTLAIGLSKRGLIETGDAFKYVIIQIIAGICGALVGAGMLTGTATFPIGPAVEI